MNETENQPAETSLPKPQTPSAPALMALGRAFNKVGSQRGIESFKAAGRGLMVAARQVPMQAPQVGDARRIKTAQAPMPKPKKA